MNVPIDPISNVVPVTGRKLVELMLRNGLHRKLETFARNLVRDPNYAEELVQYTCVVAWKNGHRIRSTDEETVLRRLQNFIRYRHRGICRIKRDPELCSKQMAYDTFDLNLAIDRMNDMEAAKQLGASMNIPDHALHAMFLRIRLTDREIKECDLRVVLIRMLKQNRNLRIFMKDYDCTINDMIALVEYWMSHEMPRDRHLGRALMGMAEALDSSREARLRSQATRELLVGLLFRRQQLLARIDRSHPLRTGR